MKNITTIILPDIPVNKTNELYYLIPTVIVLLFLITIMIYTWKPPYNKNKIKNNIIEIN